MDHVSVNKAASRLAASQAPLLHAGLTAAASRARRGAAEAPVRTTAIATAGAAALGLGYATLIERNAFTLREASMAVLEPGSASLRVLHISDLHMMPNQRLKQNWLRELDRLLVQ